MYNSFILLAVRRNYDTYNCELVAIVKFIKRYSHTLNANQQSIIYTDHKLLVKFINTDYHKDIFLYWANKLHLFKICIQYIPKKKNIIANGLSWVIFNNANCTPNCLIYKLAKKICLHQDRKRWFWKSSKDGYKNILI